MRKTITIVFGVALLFAVCASGSSLTGSAGGGWQVWPAADQDGNPYWDHTSTDGGLKNVGYCLTGLGDCGTMPPYPGAIPYWGKADGTFDPSFFWTTTGSDQSAALRIEIAGFSGVNEFGWYDTSAPETLRPIFTGPDSAGAVMNFRPSATFGLYLKSDGNIFRTESGGGSDAGNQHFAVFQAPGNGVYWIGMEDLSLANGDRDYNDMVVRIESVPEPGTFLIVGVLLVLAGGIRRIRNRMHTRRTLSRIEA